MRRSNLVSAVVSVLLVAGFALYLGLVVSGSQDSTADKGPQIAAINGAEIPAENGLGVVTATVLAAMCCLAFAAMVLRFRSIMRLEEAEEPVISPAPAFPPASEPSLSPQS